MNVAGLAWVISRHRFNKSRDKTGERLADPGSIVFLTGIYEAPVRERRHFPKQKLNIRRWGKIILQFESLATSSISFMKKIHSIPGQRDIDQLHVKQRSHKREVDSEKKYAEELAREKIKSYEYTGH